MRVADIMTRDVACCTPEMPLRAVAKLMVGCDCGIIPVIEDQESRRLMGVVTDRDITCRAIAKGMDPNTTTASFCMTAAPASVHPEESIEVIERLMSDLQIRRVPVVDSQGSCVGMVSQADVALAAPSHVLHVVTQVSKSERKAA